MKNLNLDFLAKKLGKYLLIVGFVFAPAIVSAQQTTAEGTSKEWGAVDGISMIGLVEGPSSAKSPFR